MELEIGILYSKKINYLPNQNSVFPGISWAQHTNNFKKPQNNAAV